MVIIRDNNGNVIGKEASAHYVSTRKLRNAHEQALCDKAMGIVRNEPSTAEQRFEHDFESAFIKIINGAER